MSPMQQIFLGLGAVAKKTFVDDIFSTYLWKGNSSTRSINNSIDISTEGGLVWIKSRDSANGHQLFDTERGAGKYLKSHNNSAEGTDTTRLSAFNNNGFSLGSESSVNHSSFTYAGFTFRKAPGFFDVVTWTGNGTAGRQISHSLGCVPGMILTKNRSTGYDWHVYHRKADNDSPEDYVFFLNSTDARIDAALFNDTLPTSTHFTLGGTQHVNGSGDDYVAYLFAGGESTAATARSVDFDGTGDSLSFAASNDFHLSGDFTIECWVKPEANSNEHIFALGSYGTDEGVLCYIYNDKLYVKTTGTNDLIVADPGPPIGQWTHVAVVRSGSTVNVYLNGTLTKSYTYNTGWGSNSNKTFWIGGSHPGSQFFEGKISNFRVVKGTAVYTSSFRPPTEPLTNITNTKLLCCNNSSTTGSTVTPGTITANGDPTASTDSPFDDPAAHVFGESGSESVIKCGSYVGSGSSGLEVNLGWEPSFVMYKRTDSTGDWIMSDSMRGAPTAGIDSGMLKANDSDSEAEQSYISLTSTGFTLPNTFAFANGSGNNYIYIAIRRSDGYVGKPPELGTDVFAMDTGAGGSTVPGFDSGFPVDLALARRPASSDNWYTYSRLTGTKYLRTDTNNAQGNDTSSAFDSNVGWYTAINNNYQSWMWKRHAGFDVVTYKSPGGDNFAVNHSLGKIPEMMWIKRRDGSANWTVYHKGLNGGTNPQNYGLHLNSSSAEVDDYGFFADIAPNATTFQVGYDGTTGTVDGNFIAIFFASVNGISKVGSYTGNATDSDHSTGTNTITFGFQPRMVIIKSYDANGEWVIFDTLRGWASGSGNTKRLRLNLSNAQNNENFGYPTSTGMVLTGSGSGLTNYSGRNYIYYAHA